MEDAALRMLRNRTSMEASRLQGAWRTEGLQYLWTTYLETARAVALKGGYCQWIIRIPWRGAVGESRGSDLARTISSFVGRSPDSS